MAQHPAQGDFVAEDNFGNALVKVLFRDRARLDQRLAALQGGILLARTSRQLKPLERALDMAIAQVSARSSTPPAA